MNDTTCPRCGGAGNIPRFSHIHQGICFRCWGSGDDPHSLTLLRAWLVRARKEYRARRHAAATTTNPLHKVALEKELKLLTSLGKTNRARADALEAQDH